MSERKVVLLGFDGAILSMVDLFIDDLPNFRRLMAQGCTTWAAPSMPADTPCNWTTIATGAHSSTHGIYGFNKRVPEAPLRELIPTFNSGLCRAEYLWQALIHPNMPTGRWSGTSWSPTRSDHASAAYSRFSAGSVIRSE